MGYRFRIHYSKLPGKPGLTGEPHRAVSRGAAHGDPHRGREAGDVRGLGCPAALDLGGPFSSQRHVLLGSLCPK